MQEFYIEENDAHQRLDRFLKKLFPNALKSLIYKCNRKGKIKVVPADASQSGKVGKKQDNEYRLQLGDRVQVYLTNAEIQALSQKEEVGEKVILEKKQKLEKKDIVFEDASLLVINKNPGLNVHPGEHKSKEVSLIEQASDYLKEKKLASLTFSPSLIHRIDRDTSGIILIAKDKESLLRLGQDFKSTSGELSTKTGKNIEKIYYCLVFGKLSRTSGTIKKNLLRVENAKNENKVQVSEKGQEAITHYTVLREYSIDTPKGKQIISALEVHIETGRMHQIRVHMAHIGNPILGDKNYGDKRLNAYFVNHYGVKRHMLHAWKISFTHPKRHKKMQLEARFKDDMQDCIKKIS